MLYIDISPSPNVFFPSCYLSCVACPLPGHHGGEEVMWNWHHYAMRCFGLLSCPPGSTLYTYYIIFLSMQFVNCDFAVVSYTCDIYCTSVHPGKGIPSLWLFLVFLPSFIPVKCSLRQCDCDFRLYNKIVLIGQMHTLLIPFTEIFFFQSVI